MLQRLALALNVRPEEGRLVSLLLIHSACLGMANIFMGTASNALFIEHYGAESLPYIYIAVAIVVSVIGSLYARLETKLPFSLLLIGNLATLLTGVIVLRVALFSEVSAVIIVLRIWMDVIWILSSLEFWGLAGRLFDLRQSKRLFGLIGSGDIAAKIAGGFSVTGVVALIGTENLLFVSATGIGLSLFLLTMIIGAFGRELKTAPAPPTKKKSSTSQASFFKSRYALLIFGLSALSYLVLYFVDTAFFSQAQEQFPDAAQLASFIGFFFATANIVSLIGRLFISAPLINQYGLLAGLLSLPILLVVSGVAVSVMGTLGAALVVVFWLTTLSKLFDASIRYSIYRSASLILYQPLASDQRGRMQTTVESIIEPVAAGVAGLALVFLIGTLGFGSLELFYIALALIAGWLIIIFVLNNEYTRVMVNALNKHRISMHDIDLVDAASASILKDHVRKGKPGEAVYALNLLVDVDYEDLPEVLSETLDHRHKDVRKEAYRLIEKNQIDAVLDVVRDKVHNETDESLKALAIQTYAAIGDEDIIEEIEPFLNNDNHVIEHAALVGLLHGGGIEGIMLAGQRLFTLIDAEAEDKRILAANVIGDAQINGLHRPLRKLLDNDEDAVKRSAIIAAGKLQSHKLWYRLIPYLAKPRLANHAVNALVQGGEDVLHILEEAWTAYAYKDQVLVRLVHVAERIHGQKMTNFLREKLPHSREAMRLPILRGLVLQHYGAPISEHAALQELIEAELEDATWTFTSIVDVNKGEHVDMVRNALRHELSRNHERIFLLLSFMYDRETILNIWNTLQARQANAQRQAYALEILDTLLPKEVSRQIIPLLDESISDEERLDKLSHVHPQENLSVVKRLQTLVQSDAEIVHPWTRACAIYTLAEMGHTASISIIGETLKLPSPIVRETALLALNKLSDESSQEAIDHLIHESNTHVIKLYNYVTTSPEDKIMLSTIEKVFALKSTEIFAGTPEEALIVVADILEEEELAPNELIFEKDTVGNCMYIVYHGKVRIHDGDKVLAVRGDGAVFGEMSLLDTDLRSASATADDEVLLLRLDQEPFYELMAESLEVSRGVIQMLTHRLRETTKQLSSTKEIQMKG